MENRVELHAKTKYSIDHESTLDIKELILKCVSNGEKGIAIVDKGSILSFYKAEKILKELKLKDFKLIYGVEVNVSFKDDVYKAVILLKQRKGFSVLCKLLSPYFTIHKLPLEELNLNKESFVIGLVYESDNFTPSMLQFFDYVEVNDKVSKEVISSLKKETMVVYSNRINALSKDEELSKKIIYNKLNVKESIDTRMYKSTQEILKEIQDRTIVIENPNKIFEMIEKFDLLEDVNYLPVNKDSSIDVLVYRKLKEKYGNDVPLKIKKRVDEELNLIKEFNYEGFIDLYKKIIDKCNKEQEEYVIGDYISYLYVAYLLGITYFNPMKSGLNADMFFSNHPRITIKISENFIKKLNLFIKEELKVNMIQCKGMKILNSTRIKNFISDYEKAYHINFSKIDKSNINKYLKDYPISNYGITSKSFIIPEGINIFELTPREIIKSNSVYHRFTNIDYRDIEEKFITLELISTDKLKWLMELKNITGDRIVNCNYKDKNIIMNNEFKDCIALYEKDVILDDMYEKCINSGMDLLKVFNMINEIRTSKNISNKTKKVLAKNNIITSNHNIHFIFRGILSERIRLEYELLYFKEYYPLEYYYVLIKDCPFDDVIKIIKNGVEEVRKKINDYPEYRYEHKYLKLVADLFDSNINFTIESRFIVEDYCFELDKENEKIVLIINQENNNIEKYIEAKLSIIGTRPMNGKMQYLSTILLKLIRSNKNITLFGLDGSVNFYLEYLVSKITGINRKVVRQYLNPCSCYKDGALKINEEAYISGIRYLLSHDLMIKDYHNVKDSMIDGAEAMIDKLVYFIKDSASEIIIIDRVETIGGSIDDNLKKLKEITQTKNIIIIIFTNLKRGYEQFAKKDLLSFENFNSIDKYINYINILDGDKLYLIKEKQDE